jgi:predicted metalloprotease with PDZ domain
LKGGLVVFSLDIYIRSKSKNQYSFDDVLRYLYTNFALKSIGYPENTENFIDIIKTVTKVDVKAFFHDYITGRKDPNFDDVFELLGLELKREYDKKFGIDEKSIGYLGIETEIKENHLFIRKVIVDSPAYMFGLNSNDEILALNNYRVTSKNFNERLALFKPKSSIELLINRKGKLYKINVTLGFTKPSKYTITFVKNPTEEQKLFYKNWSLQDFPNSEK